GVNRNRGRVGAADGPSVIRKACCNIPVHRSDQLINDFGDIVNSGKSLEELQHNLIDVIKEFHLNGIKSIVLGGGHEVSFPHFTGIKRAYPNKSIGVINFDAHFDLREVNLNIGSTSGTGFWEIKNSTGELNYLILGVQKISNTATLFERAHQYGVKLIEADMFDSGQTELIMRTISDFCSSVDLVYVTLDMDVFSAAFAPGVSAPASIGLFPNNEFRQIFKFVKNQPNVVAFDIAEVNPLYDVDGRTSNLAAGFLYNWLS
ncbi:MAG TPA: formimidoylglutamase, partial [Bacteroidetes bacterium]|nr:formimidoylglutamase [Bacteroidota bacterium]